MADDNCRTEEIARTTIETINKKIEENQEATEERMEVIATEIRGEMSDVHRECELNKQEIVQTKTDIHNRINVIEETRTKQMEVVERRQADMVIAHTTLGEKCEEMKTTVDAVKNQVNSDRERLAERQQREFDNLRDCLLYTSVYHEHISSNTRRKSGSIKAKCVSIYE